ncbi:MAG: hypothetical protein Q7U97_07060 [Rhodocyclaceae bacterium]|nr:hypothetical protein [Rhodocyclaceae bacterium]
MDNMTRNFTPDAALSDGGRAEPSRPQEWRESRDGFQFDLHADDWQLTSKRTLHLSALREKLSGFPVLLDGALRTLADYARRGSFNQCISLEQSFRKFLDHAPPAEDVIAETDVVGFRDFTRDRDGHDANGLEKLRPFLAQWHGLGFPGVSAALVERMEGWTLKHREQHARVNRHDPNDGPLPPDEQRALQVGALRAYEERRLRTDRYAAYRLLDLAGRRPGQLVQLKWRDMDDTRFEDAKPSGGPPRRLLLLKVPRIKGRRKWREHFRAIPLTEDEWNLLVLLKMETTQRFDRLLEATGLMLQEHDRRAIHADLPMFPGWGRLEASLAAIGDLVAQGRHGDAIALLRDEAASDAWETTAKRIWEYLDQVVAAAGATNRAGEPLAAFPTRLRYTLLANLERLGCPRTVIAWNLDHDTLISLPSYSKNGPDRAARWSKATLARMQRLAGFYEVKVVDCEEDAVGGDDPEHSRLLIANAEGGATCAVKRGCGMSIPRACYNGCPHFQPWVDGPHEAFLEELLAERDDFLNHLDPVTERATIEAADALILAVAATIHLCEERRSELAAEASQKPTRRRRAQR